MGSTTVALEFSRDVFVEAGYFAVDSFEGLITARVQIVLPLFDRIGTFDVRYTGLVHHSLVMAHLQWPMLLETVQQPFDELLFEIRLLS